MKANIRFNYVFWKEGPLSLALSRDGLLSCLLPFSRCGVLRKYRDQNPEI